MRRRGAALCAGKFSVRSGCRSGSHGSTPLPQRGIVGRRLRRTASRRPFRSRDFRHRSVRIRRSGRIRLFAPTPHSILLHGTIPHGLRSPVVRAPALRNERTPLAEHAGAQCGPVIDEDEPPDSRTAHDRGRGHAPQQRMSAMPTPQRQGLVPGGVEPEVESRIDNEPLLPQLPDAAEHEHVALHRAAQPAGAGCLGGRDIAAGDLGDRLGKRTADALRRVLDPIVCGAHPPARKPLGGATHRAQRPHAGDRDGVFREQQVRDQFIYLYDHAISFFRATRPP